MSLAVARAVRAPHVTCCRTAGSADGDGFPRCADLHRHSQLESQARQSEVVRSMMARAPATGINLEAVRQTLRGQDMAGTSVDKHPEAASAGGSASGRCCCGSRGFLGAAGPKDFSKRRHGFERCALARSGSVGRGTQRRRNGRDCTSRGGNARGHDVRWRACGELGETAQVLGGRGHRELELRAAGSAQTQPVEP